MKRENIRISVVIPVFNAADSIKRAVASVCMQDFESYEVIIVDDGSTDDSGAVCDELADEYASVRLIHKQNGGVSSARNAGIDAANGEYVMFLDADDVICDGALSMVSHFESDMVIGGFEKLELDSSVRKYCPSADAIYEGKGQLCLFLDRIIAGDNTYLLNSACFKLFRRELLEKHSIRFIEGLSYAEDKIFVMSYLNHVTTVSTLASIIYGYIAKPGSLSSDMCSDRHLIQVFRLLEEYKPLLGSLRNRYEASVRLQRLYHDDLIGRYVCRILTVFCKRHSAMLTIDNLGVLYDYMAEDKNLGVFSLRLGQVVNVILYKIGNKAFSMAFYKFVSSVYSLFVR